MKNLLYSILATAMVIFGIYGVSMADHHYGGCSGAMMGDLTEMDTDNDSFISMEEFAEPHMQKYRGWFKMLDTNDDGLLSPEEWDEFRRVHGFEKKSEG